MIRVDRAGVPVPEALTLEGRQGPNERQRAVAHFGDGGAIDGFKFSAYKNDEVKEALTRLFHGKCAYCESLYAATQPMDVEHFRPKGGVMVGGTVRKPGYWWLAATWENLLPSCIDCNRQRRQEEMDEGGGRQTVSRGKESLFPLDGVDVDTFELPTMESFAREVPLLLEPCDGDDPERLFEIVDEGVARPRAALGALERRRVLASIKVYGLNRLPLVQERGERLRRLLLQAERVRTAFVALRRVPGSRRRRATLARELDELRRMREADRPYSAASRRVADPVLERMGRSLEAVWTDRPPGPAPGSSVDLVARFVETFLASDDESGGGDDADELTIDLSGLDQAQRETLRRGVDALLDSFV